MKIIKMDKKIEKEQNRELEQFCRQIREYVQSGRIRECEQLIPDIRRSSLDANREKARVAVAKQRETLSLRFLIHKFREYNPMLKEENTRNP